MSARPPRTTGPDLKVGPYGGPEGPPYAPAAPEGLPDAPAAPEGPPDAGFTLVELLISMTIMLIVIGSVFSMVDPGQGVSKTQPEVADMQERMRIAADSIEKDLIMAGAGTYSGSIAGALANFFPPILPRRSGALNPDPELAFFDDRISIAYVPDTAAQTNVSDPMPQPSSEIKVTKEPGCPVAHPLCGFAVGMRVVIFDDTGSYDIFTITEVQEAALHLQHRPPNPDFTKVYTPAEHARISMVENHVYWLNRGANQLHHYDGFVEDIPIVDDSVGVRFTYFGDPNPPLAPRPLAGTGNCVFDAAGNPRLPVLASNGSSLVQLSPSADNPVNMLDDGPWCGAAPNRFDADLYRIRKVRVELRVQAGLRELRGVNPAGQTLFVNPGNSRGGHQHVPDYSMTFEVAPRNMNLVR